MSLSDSTSDNGEAIADDFFFNSSSAFQRIEFFFEGLLFITFSIDAEPVK
jgi:hypothetical protein